ncbi:MAG: HEPN domain-containing protein [Deltaproteobacteria bacterium]|nr:HEPN domain-containing protein [Deltaproteobacteria bacterium]
MIELPKEVKKAIDSFSEGLIKGPAGKDVLKIILFGSYVKGTAGRDSDIDLLIVTGNGEKVSQALADVTLEVQTRFRLGIEPVIVPVDDIFPVTSYFIYNVLRYGQEVFSVGKEELKLQERKNLVSLAEEYLASAEDALKGGHLRLAIDAAYNAIELYLKSLILREDDDLPGSHGGIIGRFSELYIKRGKWDKAIGREINRALELRNRARYKYQASISKEDAGKTIELAKRIEGLLEV